MNIFIDTEFAHNEFVDFDLISIGLVAADGREFYAERDDFDPALCNPFVRSNVLPLLRADGALVTSRHGLRDAVNAWLDQFKDDRPVICFDNVIDWSLLWHLLHKSTPAWLGSRNIRDRIDWSVRKRFFETTRLPEHHALYDAYANRFAVMGVAS